MTPPTQEAWSAANRRYLLCAIDLVREQLELHRAGKGSIKPEVARRLDEARTAISGLSALDFLVEQFELTPFERQLLVLSAGAELDTDLAARCAASGGEPRRPYATFGLAMAVLPDAHWDAITTARPLRHYRLIEPLGEGGITTAPLRLEERVLHFLAGIQTRDERLLGILEPLPVDRDREALGELAPSQRALVQNIVDLWSRDDQPLPAAQLCGAEQSKEAIVAAACLSRGCGLHVMRAADVPLNASERDGLARLWDREAVLWCSALLILCDDTDHADHLRAAAAFADRVGGMVAIAGREPLRLRRRLAVRIDVERPPPAEQEALLRRPRSALDAAQRTDRRDRRAVLARDRRDASGGRGAHPAHARRRRRCRRGRWRGRSG